MELLQLNQCTEMTNKQLVKGRSWQDQWIRYFAEYGHSGETGESFAASCRHIMWVYCTMIPS